MNFIQKAIKSHQENKKIEYQQSCSIIIPTIEIYINKLKENNNLFAKLRKNITQQNIDNFLWLLDIMDSAYTRFLFDLRSYQYRYKKHYYKDSSDELKEKIDYMLKKKKEYRIEFEKIYDNFKCITKGHNFPRRNEILGLMRKAFDFDSSKYYGKNIVHEIQ